jgi:hypothetical protein
MQDKERKRKVNAKSYTERKLCSILVVVSLFLTGLTAVVIFVPFTAKAEGGPAGLNLHPDSEGTTKQWTVYPAGDTTHYTRVDEDATDDDTTYVYTSTLSNVDEFNHETSTTLQGVDILNVRVYARILE